MQKAPVSPTMVAKENICSKTFCPIEIIKKRENLVDSSAKTAENKRS